MTGNGCTVFFPSGVRIRRYCWFQCDSRAEADGFYATDDTIVVSTCRNNIAKELQSLCCVNCTFHTF